jgi:hypothetical protein
MADTVNVDTAQYYLQADLRYALENPCDNSIADLVSNLRNLSGLLEVDPEESGRWWCLKLLASMKTLSQSPSTAAYESLLRMVDHYSNLVNQGLIVTQGLTRPNHVVDAEGDLLDKLTRLINKPEGILIDSFKGRLREFCLRKQMDVT